MATETLKTFLAGYGIKKVGDLNAISKQSSQTLRNWHKKESKQALIKCCIMAYRFRLDNNLELCQELDTHGTSELRGYLEVNGYEMREFEHISKQSYQTLSNWFLNPNKSHLIEVIKHAIEWEKKNEAPQEKAKGIKSFDLERVIKNRNFKKKYY